MRRTIRLGVVELAASAIVAPTGSAAERMWIGSHDNPSLRWVNDRAKRIDSSARQRATVMRLLGYWNQAAR